MRIAVVPVLLLLATARSAQGQEVSCEYVDPGNDLQVTRLPFIYITNPHLSCEGGVVLWADSAVVNTDQEVARMIGAVRYTDGGRELVAGEARYFYNVGRLQAQGSVRVLNNEDGSTVENGDLVYLRVTEYRDTEEMTFTTGSDGLRPRATVYPKRAEATGDSTATSELPADSAAMDAIADSVGVAVAAPDTAAADTVQLAASAPADTVPPEPQQYIVVGDRLFFQGEYFKATGTVEIERDSLFAYADSAEYTGERGELVLDGSARVEGSSYDLRGRTIRMVSAADGGDMVHAVGDAVLDGEDLNVTAPRISIDLVDGEVEHMVAVPMPRGDSVRVRPDTATVVPQPRAVSEDFTLTGDSLDLRAPGGVLKRVFAAGKARSVSTGREDLNVEALPEIAKTDWMDADTIEVFLIPVEPDSLARPEDEANDYEVDRIIARVGARSLYRMTPSDSTAVQGVDPPAVSYMVADEITVFMVDGQADRVESVGQVNGWHLEPLKSEPSDSTTTPEPDDTVPVEPTPGGPPIALAPSTNRAGEDVAASGAYFSPVRASQPWRLP